MWNLRRAMSREYTYSGEDREAEMLIGKVTGKPD
jgi:hypothetical protein